MTAKWLVSLVAVALCSFAPPVGHCGNDRSDPGTLRHFTAATLDKVVPGQTTKMQIEALLGQPWRTTHTIESDAPGAEVWEYRGQDSEGTYRIHIEFDSHNITSLIAKIPDKTGQAPARVAKTSPVK